MADIVELVEVETEDGLRHSGALTEPVGGWRHASVDAVLLMHGSAMNFYHPFLRFFGQGLAHHGVATLTANNRGHDLVSRPVGRLERVVRLESMPDQPEPLYGTAFESLQEVAYDWRAWMDFLVARGYRRIALWGHSRGAVKTAYYMATEKDRRVYAVILCSPPLFSYRSWCETPLGPLFLKHLSEAEERLTQGDQSLMHVRVPMDYLVSPEAYLDQYGPDERYNVLRLVPDIPGPVLVLTGTREVSERFGFAGLPEALAALTLEKADLQHVSIADGDHLYTGREEEALQIILRWLYDLPA